MRALLPAVACLLLGAATLPAYGQANPAPVLRITGQVRHPMTLDLAALRAMPNATVQWSTANAQGSHSALYEGPLLWDLVRQAEPIDAEPRTHLQHIIMAHGSDGYAAAIAIGEIDPEFEGKKVIVSLPRGGQPTLQLAVPNDAKGGRGVHELVELEVR